MNAAQRLVVARELQVGFEARDLPAVRVPVHDEVDEPKMLAVEHDHVPAHVPKTRASNRLTASSSP